VRYVMGTSGDRERSAQLTDAALAAEVTRNARCADGTVDPDEWFPVSTEAEAARLEAADAIAICTACPVRGACLELSLRHWTIGQHGVWGGLVAADRVALRRRWLASPHEHGRVLSILDGIWDGPAATSHAGRGDGAATAPGISPHALSSMRAVRMARALLRHLTAAAPGRDQARPGGRSSPRRPRSRRWGRRWPGRCRRWTTRMPRSEPMLGRKVSTAGVRVAGSWPTRPGHGRSKQVPWYADGRLAVVVAQPDQEVITVSAIPARPPRITRLARTLGLDGNPRRVC
jgi:Transcription factor WhiB